MSLREDIAAEGGLVNAADLARAWKVSATRVGTITREPTFPAPVATVGGRPAWTWNAAHGWRRRRAETLRKRRQRGQRGGTPLAR